MEVGYFTMPSHPPECGLKEGNDWDLQVLRWLAKLGAGDEDVPGEGLPAGVRL